MQPSDGMATRSTIKSKGVVFHTFNGNPQGGWRQLLRVDIGHKNFWIALVLVYGMSTSVTNAESFGYLGGHLGFASVANDTTVTLGNTTGNQRASNASYGAEGLYLTSASKDGLAFGGSISYFTTKVDNTISSPGVGTFKMPLRLSYSGIEPVIGKITTIKDGRKSLFYAGYDYYFNSSVKFDCSNAGPASGICSFSNSNLMSGPAHGASAGFIIEVAKGFGIGFGGRMIFSTVQNPYEVFISAGLVF